MKRVKRYQGGSILTFIVVAVVVAALLIGGVLWLRQRGEVAREATKVVITDDVPVKQEVEKKEETKKQTEASSTKADGKQGTKGTSVHTPAELPETGPIEAVASMVALAAIVYTTTRYIVSRSELAQAVSSTPSL